MKKRWGIAAVLLGLLAYLVAYYFFPLSSIRGADNQPMTRSDIVLLFGLHPCQWMLSSWFGSPPQFTFADRLPILATAGVILAWAFAAGRLALTLIRVDRELTRLETFVFAVVVGLNLLSTWMLIAGLLGCLNRTWTVVVPMAATFLAFAVWRYRRKRHGHQRLATVEESDAESFRSSPPPSADEANAADVHWLWLTLPFCLAILLMAPLPPTDFDVCAYHLQTPKEFLQQGRISFVPHNAFSNMPMGSEMLSMLAMLCMGDWWWGALAGKTVLAAFTPLCALGIFAAGRRLHSAPAGAIAALVYISTPWVISMSPTGLVESVLACYAFLAFFAFMLSYAKNTTKETSHAPSAETGSPRGSIRLLALSGYLAGGAVATKYPALLFLLPPLLVAIAAIGFRRSRAISTGTTESRGRLTRFMRTTAKPLMVFVLTVGLGCGLWLGKNWALTGNPTYPLLYSAFGGKTRNDVKEQHWNTVHRPHNFSARALGTCFERIVLTSEWISPLIVPMVVLAFFRKRVPGFVWALSLCACYVIVAWWLFAPRIDRFWMPITSVLALLAGIGACWNRRRWWRITLAGLLVLGVATNFVLVSSDRANAWFIPIEPLRSNPRWIDPWHLYLNENTTASDAVLVVGTPAVFHLKPRAYYNTCFDDCVCRRLIKNKTPDEARRALAAKGIAYVLVDWDAIDRYRRAYGFADFVQPAEFDRLVRAGVLAPIPPMEGVGQRVYRVIPR